MLIASYLAIIRRRWWIILSLPVILGAVAYVNTDSDEASYEATSTLLIRNVAPLAEEALPPELAEPVEGEAIDPAAAEPEGPRSLNEFLTSERIVATYANLVYKQEVLQRVLASLSLPYDAAVLRDKIEAAPVGNTQLIDVTATDGDPELAAAIANEVATAFVAVTEQETGVAGTILIAEQAGAPSTPLSVDSGTALVLAVSAGLLIAALLVLLLEHIDDTIRTPEEVEAVAGLPILGVIGRNRKAGRVHPIGLPIGEDYRDLRASLRALSDRTGLKTVLIAGHGRRDGRTLTAFNLGLMLSEAGEPVYVVDGDLRQPALHKVAKVENHEGLSTLLAETDTRANLPAVLVNADLELITAGPPVKNPSAIASTKMAEILEELASGVSYVILDSPALSAVSDAAELARIADGTVIVVQAGRTRAEVLRSTVAMLEQRGARLLGVVLNKGKSPRRQAAAYQVASRGREKTGRSLPPLRRERRAGAIQPGAAGTRPAVVDATATPESAEAAASAEKTASAQESRRVTPFSKVRQRMNGSRVRVHAGSNGAGFDSKAGLGGDGSARTG